MITADKKIDMHIHSLYSDGENSIRDILKIIKKNKIHLFSICDHNYISPETVLIKKLANKNNIIFLQGIELSCIDRETGKSLHILGYSHNFNVNLLNKSMQFVINGYNKRAKKIIEKLNKQYKGVNLDIKKLCKNKKEIYTSRNTIADELIKFLNRKGVHLTMEQAVKEVRAQEDDSWMLDSREAIRIIKNAGGYAVLAHPGKLTEDANFELFLKRLIDYGITGIEAHYPKHDEGTMQFLNLIGEKYNLFITAGSDWHGEKYTPGVNIGFIVENNKYQKITDIFIPQENISHFPANNRHRKLIYAH